MQIFFFFASPKRSAWFDNACVLKADHRGPSKTLQQNTDTNNENLGLSFFLLELSKNKSFHCFIFFNLYLKTYTVVLTQQHTITHTTRSELSTAVEQSKENNNNKTTHTHRQNYSTRGPTYQLFLGSVANHRSSP